ncbi:MAG: hypothetical protein KME45_19590 [Stenomitos rutilans HA7619-LM2]|jgi:hypothetical protein|nr:hypothetical protein [Stenomitos rutilans HA7619-LM2]
MQPANMAGVDKLAITATAADLKQRLRQAKTASDPERLQRLALLQSGQATTTQSAGTVLGCPRVTVPDWLRLDRRGGLQTRQALPSRTGRRQSLPQGAQAALNQQWHEREGCPIYGESCPW